MIADPRLQVASVAMGSPDWLGPLQRWGLGAGHPAFDRAAALNPLTLAPQVIPPRPLLMLHGVIDEVVPADGVIALEERLRPLYAAHPERLELRLYPEPGPSVHRRYALAHTLPGSSSSYFKKNKT